MLNINTTTRKGINYRWYTMNIPLYLKILNFFDRHYSYKYLVKEIVKYSKDDKERVIKIFAWTHNNIRKTPLGFPVIDDHTWNIIIRGYGASDQSSDVFTTLCNYAGIKAFYSLVSTPDQRKAIPFSFVKLGTKWYIFDPYRGVYFKNTQGELADIEFIKSDKPWIMEIMDEEPNLDYIVYFKNLPSIKESNLTRANTQSPLNRLIFEIRKRY